MTILDISLIAVATICFIAFFITLICHISYKNRNKIEIAKKEKELLENKKQISLINNSLIEMKETLNSVPSMTQSINNINNLFSGKKNKGIIGDFVIDSILTESLGDNNNILWEKNKILDNGQKIDFVINMKQINKIIGIDTKLPIDTFLKMTTSDKMEEQEILNQHFRATLEETMINLKQKLLNTNLLSSAIVFVPSESMFSHILSNYKDLVEKGINKQIYIASATTLGALLWSIKQFSTSKSLSDTLERFNDNLEFISNEFFMWVNGWERFVKMMKELNDIDIKSLSTRSEKLRLKLESLKLESEREFKNKNILSNKKQDYRQRNPFDDEYEYNKRQSDNLH